MVGGAWGGRFMNRPYAPLWQGLIAYARRGAACRALFSRRPQALGPAPPPPVGAIHESPRVDPAMTTARSHRHGNDPPLAGSRTDGCPLWQGVIAYVW